MVKAAAFIACQQTLAQLGLLLQRPADRRATRKACTAVSNTANQVTAAQPQGECVHLGSCDQASGSGKHTITKKTINKNGMSYLPLNREAAKHPPCILT